MDPIFVEFVDSPGGVHIRKWSFAPFDGGIEYRAFLQDSESLKQREWTESQTSQLTKPSA
jgi:hypothetical protein